MNESMASIAKQAEYSEKTFKKAAACYAAKLIRSLENRLEHIYGINGDVFVRRTCIEVFGEEVTTAGYLQLGRPAAGE